MAYSEWFISRSNITSFLEAIATGKKYDAKWDEWVKRLYFLRPLLSLFVKFLKKSGLLYKSAGYTTPADLLSEFKFIEVSGLKVRVPQACEGVLEFVYGGGWRIPKQEYDWVKESPSTRVSNSRFHK